jgi:hypothetical protein
VDLAENQLPHPHRTRERGESGASSGPRGKSRGLCNGEYGIDWAKRYLRESKAELCAASKAKLWFVASGLAMSSMRKSQAAIYCVLGDPETVESVVRSHLSSELRDLDALLRTLVRMERFIASNDFELGPAWTKSCLADAARIHEAAQKIVDLMT